MLTHKELKSRALSRTDVKAEYDRLGKSLLGSGLTIDIWHGRLFFGLQKSIINSAPLSFPLAPMKNPAAETAGYLKN